MASTARLYTGPDQVLLCTACREEKSVLEFALRSDTNVPRVRSACRDCLAKKATTKNRENHADAQVYWWARQIAKYGLTPDVWEAMFNGQGRRCAICGVDENGAKRFHVDHDHVTKRIRGILCTKCNVGIGALKDNPDLVFKAFVYLTRAVLPGDQQDHHLAVSVNPSTSLGNTEAIRESGESVETTRETLLWKVKI